MGRQPKDTKTDTCITCNLSFDRIKRHAKNMCQPCYSRAKKGIINPRKKDLPPHCSECKLEYGALNEKGKEVKKGSMGMCKLCYSRAYSLRNEPKPCRNCGRTMRNGLKNICQLCDDELKDKFYKENPHVRKSESFRNKQIAEKVILTDEQFELIRRLFVKFKLGSQNSADFFRVVDIYLDLFNCDAFLDSYCEQEQVIIMLKRLKVIWDKNSTFRKAELEKKRLKQIRKLNKTNI